MNKEKINEVFEAFNKGCLIVPKKTINFEQVEWSKHPTFEGVELKHIIKGEQTDEKFSYHLVRIAPGKSIYAAPKGNMKFVAQSFVFPFFIFTVKTCNKECHVIWKHFTFRFFRSSLYHIQSMI